MSGFLSLETHFRRELECITRDLSEAERRAVPVEEAPREMIKLFQRSGFDFDRIVKDFSSGLGLSDRNSSYSDKIGPPLYHFYYSKLNENITPASRRIDLDAHTVMLSTMKFVRDSMPADGDDEVTKVERRRLCEADSRTVFVKDVSGTARVEDFYNNPSLEVSVACALGSQRGLFKVVFMSSNASKIIREKIESREEVLRCRGVNLRTVPNEKFDFRRVLQGPRHDAILKVLNMHAASSEDGEQRLRELFPQARCVEFMLKSNSGVVFFVTNEAATEAFFSSEGMKINEGPVTVIFSRRH